MEYEVGEKILLASDFEGFSESSRRLTLEMLIRNMQKLTAMATECYLQAGAEYVKYIGDSFLGVFPADRADAVALMAIELKTKLEFATESMGMGNKTSFAMHIGEVALGQIGFGKYLQNDVYGETVNATFMMMAKPYKGRFNISPQVFRKLSAESRKRFHKFTPPIVYIAE